MRYMGFGQFLFIVAISCSSPMQAPDAAPADAQLQCPSSNTARASDFYQRMGDADADPFAAAIYPWSCGDVTVGTGCVLTDDAPEAALLLAASNACGWRNWTDTSYRGSMTLSCWRFPDPVQEVPTGCPAAQPLAERVQTVRQSGELSSMRASDVTANCPESSVLLGGGRSVELSSPANIDVVMPRLGLTDDSNTAWTCSWNNMTSASIPANAFATCVTPPTQETAPEAESLTERMHYVRESIPLPTLGQMRVTSTCDDGQFLVMGGCMLDSIEPPLDEITMLRPDFNQMAILTPGSADGRI